MKKAKIMLSAITVLAIVGGSLAFTAKKITTTLYTVVNDGNTCTGAQVVKTKTSGTPTISASTESGGVCTTFTIQGS